MATSLKVTGNYLNPYERYHNELQSKFGYDESLWQQQAMRGEQDLDFYIQTLNSDKIDPVAFQEKWRTDLLSPEDVFNLMANEAFGDDTDETRKERFDLMENGLGDQIKVSIGEMTDKEYNEWLYSQYQNQLIEKEKLEAEQRAKDEMNGWEKFAYGAVSFGTALTGGVGKGVDWGLQYISAFFSALAEGVAAELTNFFPTINYNNGMVVIDPVQKETFTEAFNRKYHEILTSDEGTIFKQVGITEAIENFNKELSPFYNIDGSYKDNFGGMLMQVLDSFGTYLPYMALSMAGVPAGAVQFMYYGNMAAGNIIEMENNPAFNDVATWKIMLNGTLKAGAEYAVERLLRLAAGPSILDEITFGVSGKIISKGTATSAVLNILKSGLQEGVEEALQELSGQLLDAVFGILGETKFSEQNPINLDNIGNAFIVGALASVLGSGFSFIVSNFDRKGNAALPKMNPLARWDLKRAIKEFQSNVFEIINSDMPVAKKQQLLGSAYSIWRTTSAVFTRLGAEKFDAGMKLLEEMETYTRQKNAKEKAIIAEAEHLMGMFENSRLGAIAEQHAKAFDIGEEVGKVNYGDDDSVLTDEEAKAQFSKIKELLKNSGLTEVHVMKYGTNPFRIGNKMFVPLNMLKQVDDVNEIFKSSEDISIVTNFMADDSLKPALEQIFEIYKKVSNDKDANMEVAILNLLFNESFQTIALQVANRDVVQLLANLIQISEAHLGKTKVDAIFKERMKQARDNLRRALIVFYINQQFADVETSVLTKAQVKYIHEKRYSKDLRNRIIEGDKELKAEDLQPVYDRIDYMAVTNEEKKRLKDNLTKKSKAKEVFDRIDQYYRGLYNSLYDGFTYLEVNGTITNAVFNQFLHDYNITIRNLTELPADDNLQEEFIQKFGDNINEESTLAFWQEKFREYTQGSMAFVMDVNTVEVGFSEGVVHKNYERINTDITKPTFRTNERTHVSPYTDGTPVTKHLVNKNLSKAEQSSVTLNQIILNPNKYLDEKIKNEIVADENYGDLRPTTVFVYLREYLLKKSHGAIGIVVRQDGTFQYANVRPSFTTLKQGIAAKPDVKKQYRLSNFVKKEFLIGRTVDTKVVFHEGDSYYDYDKNTIFINKYDSHEVFQFELLHEFQHAIQAEMNLNFGLDSDWIFKLPKDTQDAILSDYQAMRPELFKNKKGRLSKLRAVNDFIYANSGEAEAYGTMGMMTYDGSSIHNIYPVVVNTDGKKLRIVTDMGSVYDIDPLGKASVIVRHGDSLTDYRPVETTASSALEGYERKTALYPQDVVNDPRMTDERLSKLLGRKTTVSEAKRLVERYTRDTEHHYNDFGGELNSFGMYQKVYERLRKYSQADMELLWRLFYLTQYDNPPMSFEEFYASPMVIHRLSRSSGEIGSPLTSVVMSDDVSFALDMMTDFAQFSMTYYLYTSTVEPRNAFPYFGKEVMVTADAMEGANVKKVYITGYGNDNVAFGDLDGMRDSVTRILTFDDENLPVVRSVTESESQRSEEMPSEMRQALSKRGVSFEQKGKNAIVFSDGSVGYFNGNNSFQKAVDSAVEDELKYQYNLTQGGMPKNKKVLPAVGQLNTLYSSIRVVGLESGILIVQANTSSQKALDTLKHIAEERGADRVAFVQQRENVVRYSGDELNFHRQSPVMFKLNELTSENVRSKIAEQIDADRNRLAQRAESKDTTAFTPYRMKEYNDFVERSGKKVLSNPNEFAKGGTFTLLPDGRFMEGTTSPADSFAPYLVQVQIAKAGDKNIVFIRGYNLTHQHLNMFDKFLKSEYDKGNSTAITISTQNVSMYTEYDGNIFDDVFETESRGVSASATKPMEFVTVDYDKDVNDWYKGETTDSMTATSRFGIVLPDGSIGYSSKLSFEDLSKDAKEANPNSNVNEFDESVIKITIDPDTNNFVFTFDSNGITKEQAKGVERVTNQVLEMGMGVRYEQTQSKQFLESNEQMDGQIMLREFMSSIKNKEEVKTAPKQKTDTSVKQQPSSPVKERTKSEKEAIEAVVKPEGPQREGAIANKKGRRYTNAERRRIKLGKESKPSRIYISNERARKSNLRFFIKKNRPIQMRTDLAGFIAATDYNGEGIESELWDKIGGKHKGTLTMSDIYQFIHDTASCNQHTFDLLNKYIFKNTRIKTFETLKAYTEIVPVRYYTMRAWLRQVRDRDNEAEELLNRILTYKQFNSYYNSMYENDEKFRKFAQTMEERFNTVNGEELTITDKDMRLPFMKYFDGTIDSGGYAAAIVKIVDIHSKKGSWKKPFQEDTASSAVSYDRELEDGENLTFEGLLADFNDASSTVIGREDQEELKQRFLESINDMTEDQVIDELVNRYIDYALKYGISITEDQIRKVLATKSINDLRIIYAMTDIESMTLNKFSKEESLKLLEGKIDVKVNRTRKSIRTNVKRMATMIKNRVPQAYKKKFLKMYSEYFDDDLNLKQELYVDKSLEDVLVLEETIRDIKRQVEAGIFTLDKYQKVQQKLARITAQNERLRREKTKLYEKNLEFKEYDIGGETYQITGNVDMPDTVKEIIRKSQHEDYVNTNVKYVTNDGELHMEVDGAKFYEANAQTLGSLTDGQIDEIINFFEYARMALPRNSNLSRRFNSYALFTLAYILDHHYTGERNLTQEQREKIKRTIQEIGGEAGTTLATLRRIAEQINPNRQIIASIAKSLEIELSEEKVDKLVQAIRTGDVKKMAEEMEAVQKDALEKYKLKYRSKNRKIRRQRLFDTLLNLQRMFMLSSPGTAIRNAVSNQLLTVGNEVAGLLGNRIWKKHKDGQYILAGTDSGLKLKMKYVRGKGFVMQPIRVDSEVAKFIKKEYLDSGLFDLIKEGGTKYDPRKKHTKIQDVLTQMITTKIKEDVFQLSAFGYKTDKNGIIYDKKTGKPAPNALQKVYDFVYKMLSDAPWVNKNALNIFAKMLTEDKVDLSKGNTPKILEMFAEAYKLASYNYMHKANFWNAMEDGVRQKLGPSGYFVYKQILPFASASWNWFLEYLNWGPVGIIDGIRQLRNLESQIERMDEARQKGETSQVSSRFAEYLAKRKLGKGIIGSFALGVGILLRVLGFAGIDEEDDKIKLTFGKLKIDISDFFGSSSLLVGVALTDPFMKEHDGKWYDIAFDYLYSVTDTLFLDSTFSDLFNTFRYDQSFGEFLVGMPMETLDMFVPNAIKVFNRLLYNRELNYSDGVVGALQSFAARSLPGLAYLMPVRIDPYTGQKQPRYKIPVLIELINSLSPIKFDNYDVSENEQIAIELGVNKAELTGRYTDIGNLSGKDVEKLNRKYGELNKQALDAFFANQTKYRVETEDGKYKTLRFNQMTDKQKKNAIERIMSDNAKIAKIYVYTESGGKYYASDSMYKELLKLGIRKNVYKETNKLEGFV